MTLPGLVTHRRRLANTPRAAKDPNCARLFSYSAQFLSQLRHAKLIHSRRFERRLFLDVILILQSRENRPRLRYACRSHALISKISRTENTHWIVSPFEYCLNFIKTGTCKKNLVSFSILTRSKLRWRAPRVNWPWGQFAVVWSKITSK